MLRQMFVPITAYVRVKQKMAKQGSGLRLLISVGFSYSDLVMDVLVTKGYYDGGQSGLFALAGVFLVLPLLVQAFVAKFCGQSWGDVGSATADWLCPKRLRLNAARSSAEAPPWTAPCEPWALAFGCPFAASAAHASGSLRLPPLHEGYT